MLQTATLSSLDLYLLVFHGAISFLNQNAPKLACNCRNCAKYSRFRADEGGQTGRSRVEWPEKRTETQGRLAAFLESKERLSPGHNDSSADRFPPARRGLSVIRLFPIVVAVAVVAVAALSLSCTWQERMQQDLAFGVNQIRAEHGLGPLTVDPQLSAIAQYRAQDMASKGYFSHNPPDGCPVRCLMERAGLAPAWAGEVIAWNNTTVDQSVDMTIGMWRNSPAASVGHNERLLHAHGHGRRFRRQRRYLPRGGIRGSSTGLLRLTPAGKERRHVLSRVRDGVVRQRGVLSQVRDVAARGRGRSAAAGDAGWETP